MKNKKIWLLLDSKKPGGIESHVLQLAKGMHSFNLNVSVIFLTDYGNHPLRDALKKHGIETKSLDGRIISLWTLMKKEPPSVVHTHGYKAGIFGRIVSKFLKIPVVSTYHAGETSNGKLALYQWIDEKSARLASHIYAVSPQIAKRLPANAVVADNFVDINDIELSNGKQIAFVGRLSEEKGADYYLQLASRVPTLKFHIYGDGPLSDELKTKASNNVIFHGQQDDMSNVWPKIGLLIMPSRNEGLPMSALEAMGRGIPVLASKVGALNELVCNGINGWLTPAGNVDELTTHLLQWLQMNEELKLQFKMAARMQIEKRFSTNISIPKIIAYYRQVTK